MPTDASLPEQFLAEGLGRLVADDLVHPQEGRAILRRERIPRNAGHVLDHRRARAALQRIDLGIFAVVLEGLFTVADLGGIGPDEGEVGVGRRPHHKVTLGHLALIIRWQQQVLAALALVFAGRADIGHEQEVVIVQRPHDTGWHLEDRRAVLFQVKHDKGIEALGIACQNQGAGVQSVRGDADM